MTKRTQALCWLLSFGLLGCSGGLNLREKIPDRRPDYRQSNVSRQLELPPDLVGQTLSDQLNVPALSGNNSVSYQDYNPNHLKRNSRGYLDVLPALDGVRVVETAGALPYILVDANPNVTWLAVKKYWENSGIRLKTLEPAIGLMETDWLEDVSQLPKTGISGFLNDLIKFTHDSGKRDRYRIRFTRAGEGRTSVTVLYSQAEEKARGTRRDPDGYEWRLADNDNPELQLEMTRRLALFIASDLKRTQARGVQISAPARGQLSSLNGQPVLILDGDYKQAWQELGAALDKAGFVLEHQNYKNGTYQVSLEAEKAAKEGFFSRVFARDETPKNDRYLIRIADQGARAVVVVQTLNGQAETAATAQAVLTRLNQAL